MKFLHYFWIVLWFFMFDFFSQGINVFIHIFFFITSVISKFIAVIYISWIPQIYHKYHRGIITIAVDFGEKEREKEREKAIARGLGGRPARERPCRRRSSCFFQIKLPGSGLLLVSAGSRLSDLWSATNRFGSGPGVTTRWLCRWRGEDLSCCRNNISGRRRLSQIRRRRSFVFVAGKLLQFRCHWI